MSDQELRGNLPLQYIDGPDYCTVKDATGMDFALTVQPDLMKMMETAVNNIARLTAERDGLRKALEFYRDNWRMNGDGDPETSGLSRSWMEPNDELFSDEGRAARCALATSAETDAEQGGER